MAKRPVIAITPGEPGGIGPELCAALDAAGHAARLVLIASRKLLEQAAVRVACPLQLKDYGSELLEPRLECLDVPLIAPAVPGQLNQANSPYVIDTINRALEGCNNGTFDALVTGPVHKGIINDAGIPFTGHTDYLAQCCKARGVVMMLTAGKLRVALVTTHLPLKRVSEAITRRRVEQTIRTVHRDLRLRFGLCQPTLLVCGLNPHAGEGGHLGREEIEIIEPVVRQLGQQGFDLLGPLPADSAFTRRHLEQADAVIAMYHDQGLPVLKHASFGHAVNITLGLPIIRTSVDHGTALDIAGSGKAESGSLEAAIDCAIELCDRVAS
jgi:4-hydroxythreonine-4-phosphate dehydrogenase